MTDILSVAQQKLDRARAELAAAQARLARVTEQAELMADKLEADRLRAEAEDNVAAARKRVEEAEIIEH